MKNNKIVVLGLAILVSLFTSCKRDLLQETPIGEIPPVQMTTKDNVERAIISAYKVLNGQVDNESNAFSSPASNWSFGDVVSDDAYKGGGGTGDQNQIHQMEIFNTNPTIFDVQKKWTTLYEGIKRVNTAIRLLNASTEYDETLKSKRLGELRFLRGHYYFELKKIYNRIPYIDETVENIDEFQKSNVEHTSEQLWGKIEDDFKAAKEALPQTQEQVGRPTKFAAEAYLAKTYLFQQKWKEVYDEITPILTSQYHLFSDFGDLFLPENDNNPEIIFAVQQSINDGEPNNYNGSIGDRLSLPGGPRYSQYGFHRPSQNLINAFKTDSSGLPVTDKSEVQSSDFVDPRLDITVGRPGIPYLDLDILYSETWERDLATYGPYAPKKRIVSANSPFFAQSKPWTNALNYYIIRYAEVLLWRAEAAVELGKLEEARSLVNQIRKRAKDTKYVQKLDGSGPAANYRIDLYNTPWTSKDQATQAVHLESRLEKAMEGHRFFDLVRWGVADQVINDYLNTEKLSRTFLSNAHFTKGKNEYFPIPQKYVDMATESEPVEQNEGYPR